MEKLETSTVGGVIKLMDASVAASIADALTPAVCAQKLQETEPEVLARVMAEMKRTGASDLIKEKSLYTVALGQNVMQAMEVRGGFVTTIVYRRQLYQFCS